MGDDEAAWRQIVEELADTPLLAEVAERHIPIRTWTADRDTWRHVTELAVGIREAVVERTCGPTAATPTTRTRA